MHLGATVVAVSGWWKSILDGGYSGASSHISLDMNLRLRSTCRSSPFGFSFLVSFVLLPATSTVSIGNTFLPPSILTRTCPPRPTSPDSSILFRLASLPPSRFSHSPSFCIENCTTCNAHSSCQIFVSLLSVLCSLFTILLTEFSIEKTQSHA